jgi:indole-3-glycerol phosphate synthase
VTPPASSPDVLAAIVAATRTRVHEARRATPLDEVQRAGAWWHPRRAAFLEALCAVDRLPIIAECKRRSPSRGVLRAAYDPVAIARGYEAADAAAISVLTEPGFFDGDLRHLRAVRDAVSAPLLRKDFIVDAYQLHEAVAHGADAVLLIVAALDDGALRDLREQAEALHLAVLVETHSENEVRRALDTGATLIGVNNRNLRTLEVDIELSARVAAWLPDSIITVSESGLRHPAEVHRLRTLGYRAFLMGERFMTTPDPGASLRAFLREAQADAH